MEDSEIISLFEARSEEAIKELNQKYYPLCYKIAWNILNNHEDSEECVNDTWLSAWNYIPPQKPKLLSAFLCKIVRGHAIDNKRKKIAGKRADSHMADVKGEIEKFEIITRNLPEETLVYREFIGMINDFLWKQSKKERDIFLMRYWYMDSIKEIARCYGMRQGSVRSSLCRTRRKLLQELEKEGMIE